MRLIARIAGIRDSPATTNIASTAAMKRWVRRLARIDANLLARSASRASLGLGLRLALLLPLVGFRVEWPTSPGPPCSSRSFPVMG